MLDFFGAGDAKSHINLATGTHSSHGFVHKDYCSSEYALTSNGGVAHIPSMSVNYATSAGSAPASDVYSWAKASSKPSYTYSEVGAAPASHTHSKSQITDFPSSLPANGGTATNAYNDQNGSNIVNTYATKD